MLDIYFLKDKLMVAVSSFTMKNYLHQRFEVSSVVFCLKIVFNLVDGIWSHVLVNVIYGVSVKLKRLYDKVSTCFIVRGILRVIINRYFKLRGIYMFYICSSLTVFASIT